MSPKTTPMQASAADAQARRVAAGVTTSALGVAIMERHHPSVSNLTSNSAVQKWSDMIANVGNSIREAAVFGRSQRWISEGFSKQGAALPIGRQGKRGLA
jgi:hypothetical protein